MTEGKRASPKWDVPAALWGGPFSACRLPREAPAPVLTHSCWLLLFAVTVKSIPGEGWDKPCQGTRKARSVAVGLTNVRMFTVPVGTLISLLTSLWASCQKEIFKFSEYCGRERSFETQVIWIAQFRFSETEMSWVVLGSTQPSGPVGSLPRELHATFSRRKISRLRREEK